MRATHKPRILMITARADIGGGPRHVFDLAGALHNEVALFISSPEEKPYADKFRAVSEGFFEIPKRQFSFLVALRLLRFCAKHRIDIVHSHGRGAGAYSRFLGIFGYRVVHTFHGFHVQQGIKGALILAAERLLQKLTKVSIAVSSGEFERAIGSRVAGHGKTELIYNGIPSTPEGKIKGRTTPFVFGALTRFDPQKGNDVLIDAISKLPKELRSLVKFRIAGEGPELPKLQRQLSTSNLGATVELIGPVSDPDPFLSQIDAFVSASRGEGLSYATLESLRARRPLLLSEVTGHVELMGLPGVYFFSLNDHSSFTEKIQTILNSPDIAPTLPEKFSLDSMAKRVLDLYQRVRSH